MGPGPHLQVSVGSLGVRPEFGNIVSAKGASGFARRRRRSVDSDCNGTDGTVYPRVGLVYFATLDIRKLEMEPEMNGVSSVDNSPIYIAVLLSWTNNPNPGRKDVCPFIEAYKSEPLRVNPT
jgi:hypothetical protein